MSEERPPELSPQKMAEARAVALKMARGIRNMLILGTPIEAVKSALVDNGAPKELAEKGVETVRDQLKREATIDRNLEVANTLERFEILFSLAMQNGEFRTALEVVRERAKFTRAADFVKFTSSEEKRREAPTEYDQALDDLGPVGREQLDLEIKARILELGREARRKNAT